MLGFLAYPQIGEATPVLSVLPVVAAGQSHGSRGGLLTAILVSPLNTFLLNLTGHEGWDALFRTPVGLLGTVLLIFMGVAVGQMIDLRARVAQPAQARLSNEYGLPQPGRSALPGAIRAELRGGLQALSAAVERIRSGQVGDPARQHELLSEAELEARRMIATVDELEDLARFEEAEPPITWEPLDLIPLVAETVQVFQPYAASKALALVQISAQRSIVVRGDRQQLRRCFFRLLVYAVRASPLGSQVVIVAELAGSEAQVEIVDYRPAGSAEALPQVTSAPPDLERPPARGTPFGLGLYVARRVVESYGGRLAVEPESPSGNTLRISLPRHS